MCKGAGETFNGIFFPHSHSGDDLGATLGLHSCGGKNPLYPIRANSFVSIIILMFRNPNKTTINKF
jgi:hypothetical protein